MSAEDPAARLPGWWQPLLDRVRAARVEDFTRWPTPAEGGRDSAVLVLLAEADAACRSRPQPALSADAACRNRPQPALSADAACRNRPQPALSADHDGGPSPDVLVLQRAATLRNHAGQPAFPGGAAEPGDAGAAETALREAWEEVGLDPASVTVLAELPKLWISVSDFVVTPVLAWWHAPHEVHPGDPGEVARVARLPIAELVDPRNRVRVRHPSGWIGPAFQVRGMLVWGFTAGVIAALLEMAGWARPWPADRVVDLPPSGADPAPDAAADTPAGAPPAPGAAIEPTTAADPVIRSRPAATGPDARVDIVRRLPPVR